MRNLSPAATLERGYAVIRNGDGTVVMNAEDVTVGTPLRVNVAVGEFTAARTDPKVVP